jgi:hypothetical protein
VDVGRLVEWGPKKQFTLQPDNFVKNRREKERGTGRGQRKRENSVIREFPLCMVRQPSKHRQSQFHLHHPSFQLLDLLPSCPVGEPLPVVNTACKHAR